MKKKSVLWTNLSPVLAVFFFVVAVLGIVFGFVDKSAGSFVVGAVFFVLFVVVVPKGKDD